MGFIGLGLGLGVFRLADYQIVEADKLRERADARRLLAQTLYAKRGTIYDRNGNVLASSVECRNIAVNPQLVEDVDKTVSALVKATGIDIQLLLKRHLFLRERPDLFVKRPNGLVD